MSSVAFDIETSSIGGSEFSSQETCSTSFSSGSYSQGSVDLISNSDIACNNSSSNYYLTPESTLTDVDSSELSNPDLYQYLTVMNPYSENNRPNADTPKVSTVNSAISNPNNVGILSNFNKITNSAFCSVNYSDQYNRVDNNPPSNYIQPYNYVNVYANMPTNNVLVADKGPSGSFEGNNYSPVYGPYKPIGMSRANGKSTTTSVTSNNVPISSKLTQNFLNKSKFTIDNIIKGCNSSSSPVQANSAPSMLPAADTHNNHPIEPLNNQRQNKSPPLLTIESIDDRSCGSSMTSSELDMKLMQKRERNRIAARKCRDKKLNKIKYYETKIDNLENEIKFHEDDIVKLNSRKNELRMMLIQMCYSKLTS